MYLVLSAATSSVRGRSNSSRFIKEFSKVAGGNKILGISQRAGGMGPEWVFSVWKHEVGHGS
jgi:hypothetical protein